MESPTEVEDSKAFAAEVEALAGALDADILVYSGDLLPPKEDEVAHLCRGRRRRRHVLLMLATFGGDPHTAYRIARCLQQNYEKFYALVAGYCKSAGTLLVLGADELILHDLAELGPLDVQMRKSDEIDEHSSGLTPNQAMMSLDGRTTLTFQNLFLRLKFDMLLTTRTAAEIASSLVTGLYGGIYAQIDPIKLGEMQRALSIAHGYGERLQRNALPSTLERLVSGFPDHGFVIDREEARTLFSRVREPTEHELRLIHSLSGIYAGLGRSP